MERLKQRADFLAAAKGARVPAARSFCRRASGATTAPSRFGFTVSKKVGNAVERNRVRRRLREIVRRHAALAAASGHDYVLIGRRAALAMPFDEISAEFARAMQPACSGGAARAHA